MSVTSRYFTPHRAHTSHAVTGAIGVATAFALPGTVAHREDVSPGTHDIAILHPQGRIEVEVEVVERAGRDQRAPGRRSSAPPGRSSKASSTCPGTSSRVARTDRPGGQHGAARSDRPITLIVPTPAGGANDAIARAIAHRLGPILGRPVVVDNRAGAHGSIASEYVARADPDGHTLLLGYVATHGMNPALQRLGYDPVADFEPVGLIGYSPTVLVSGPSVPARTVEELVARLAGRARHATATRPRATARPRTSPRNCSSWPPEWTSPGVTYRGSSAALSDTVAGRTQLMFSSLFTAHPWITSRPAPRAGDRRPEQSGRPSRRADACTRPASTGSR